MDEASHPGPHGGNLFFRTQSSQPTTFKIVITGVLNKQMLYRSLDRMAKASSIRWYSHVLRKEDENVIVKALKFEVSGSRGRGRPKQTWKKQVENEIKKNGLGKEDACDGTKWRGIVKTMTVRNLANFVDGENTRSNM